MHIKNLKIYNYRNLRNTSLEFPNNGIISIIGRNGHGKTNLIESIYFLSSGRSFRTSSVNELSCWNENNRSCSVFGSVNEELSIGVTVEEKRRRYFLNDTETSISDVVGKFLTVVFSPTDIEIIRGAPSERRSFIWKHLVDVYPHILKSLVRYERAVKEKAAFLKAGNVTFKDVEPWNKILAEEGYKLIEARKNFTALLSVQADFLYRSFGSDDGGLAFDWQLSGITEEVNSSEELLKVFNNFISKEISGKRTLVGPHKDDLIITLKNHQIRKFGSQGQAKTAALAIKVGVMRVIEEIRKTKPVLLLDDIESELDDFRKKGVIEECLKSEGQVFITGTNFNSEIIDPVMRLVIDSGECRNT